MIAMREVRDIYHQGVWAVAAAFRQLYEMIDADEKRVQKLVAAATIAHLRKNESPRPVQCTHPEGVELRYRDEQGGVGAGDESAAGDQSRGGRRAAERREEVTAAGEEGVP